MNLSQKLQYAATNSDVNRQYRHFFATAGVVIGKETSTVKFKPTILLKYVQGLDKKIPDFDLNANFLFVDRFWLGAGVRTGGNRVGPYFSDIVGMFECLVTQQLRIGYSYDYVLSDLSNYTLRFIRDNVRLFIRIPEEEIRECEIRYLFLISSKN